MNARDLVNRLLESTTVLYRHGNPKLVGGFWTPDPKYVWYIHHTKKMWEARLSPRALIREIGGSPDRRMITKALRRGSPDVIVAKAWDFDTREYVVLNPRMLEDIHEVEFMLLK